MTGGLTTPLTRAEALTVRFYAWEQLGRGWLLWPYPVALEPPFIPFPGHRLPAPAVDDGKKHTFLSSLVERYERWRNPRPESPLPDAALVAPDAEPDEDDEEIVELHAALPRSAKVSREAAEHLLLSLVHARHPLGFEVTGTPESITVSFLCRASDERQVADQLLAYFPEASVRDAAGFLRSAWERAGDEALIADCALADEFVLPLRTATTPEADPLIGIAGALSNLDDGELGVLQVLFAHAFRPWPESMIAAVSDGEGRCFFPDAPEMLALAGEKVSRPLFAVAMRVAAKAHSSGRSQEIARSLGGALATLSRPGGNRLVALDGGGYGEGCHEDAFLARKTFRSGMLLNAAELVSVVHPPPPTVRSDRLARLIERTKAAPALCMGHPLVLGENEHRGRTVTVTASTSQRVRHTHVIGVSGSGKSTLLLNMIAQDMDQGNGLCLLDPHGDLIDAVLERVPEHRVGDVIVLDPADEGHPVPFNVLSAHSELEKTLLASDLVAVFRRLSTSWGDQMTSVLANAILAFLESAEGGSLADLRRFLVEPGFRKEFLPTVRDGTVRYYWEKEFPLLTGRPQAPLLTRLDAFLRPRPVRAMVARRENRLDFAGIMDGRKVLLARLSQGAIGEENAFLLGTLVVAKIHQMALGRQAVAASDRPPFFLYVDEFHNFVTPSMAAILSGARKYGLGLILAHQEWRQLATRDEDAAHAVLANAYTRICFRLGDADARMLADGFSAFDAADLQNLGVGQAIARIERNEYDFNLATFPPEAVSGTDAEERRRRVVELSRAQYATHPQPAEQGPTAEDLAEQTREAERPRVPATSKKPRRARKAREPGESTHAAVMPGIPLPLGRGGAQHKYLQQLVKRIAEANGFRATIEQPVLDGAGSVDVALERGEERIACEISIGSTDAYEVNNIQKCLAAGYARVLVVSPERRTLDKIQKRARETLDDGTLQAVSFVLPADLMAMIELNPPPEPKAEERVKGYRVKVRYEPSEDRTAEERRRAISEVVLRSLRKRKESDN
ncbi:MAG TPA: type IV secretion system DNA-binding domain-containing protein [Pyrinomonadaceae bacterium]